MRYHTTEPDEYTHNYGKDYYCNHPIYNRCTLYKIRDRGLAVIQQRFDPVMKVTRWDSIDPWLADPIYLHPGFWNYFDKHSEEPDAQGLFPTVTIRQIMWALRMKPLEKQRWETVFDRKIL